MKDYTVEQKVELIKELLDEVKSQVCQHRTQQEEIEAKDFSDKALFLLSLFQDWYKDPKEFFSSYIQKQGL